MKEWLFTFVSAEDCRRKVFSVHELLFGCHFEGCRNLMSCFEEQVEELVSPTPTMICYAYTRPER